MIKAISYWAMKDGLANTHPIDDAIAQAKAHGFAGLELCIGTEGALSVDTSKEQCQAIRKQIDEAGLIVQTVASGMSWGFNPTSNDPAVREKAIALHAAALERTAWLGCEAMLFVPGVVRSPICPDECVRYDHAVERAAQAVTQLLETADRVGVDLCLENVWNGLFYSPMEFASFVDRFDHPRLGIYFDVGNVLGYQQYPPHWIELLGDRIKRVHIKGFKDTFGFEGQYAFCGLREGDVPWEASMQALRAIGYDKTIVAEMMPWNENLLTQVSADMDAILAG